MTETEPCSCARAQAYTRFNEGYNCAQSVLCAYAGGFGLDNGLALKLASGFGAGLGSKQELCGAVSGAVMALGLAYGGGSGAAETKEHNAAVYEKVQELTGRFLKEKGTLICKDLLKNHALRAGEKAAAISLRESCCAGLVALSCALLEETLAAGDTL